MLESLRSAGRAIRARPLAAASYCVASLVTAWAIAVMATGIANAQPRPADDSCKKGLDGLVAQWRSIAVPGTPPGNAQSPRHGHTALEVWYMRSQLRLARRLCDEGDEHEAMLRMDVVRAWLKLPEVSHPADHWSLYDEPDIK